MRCLLLFGLVIALVFKNIEVFAFDETKLVEAETVFMPRIKYPGSRGNHLHDGFVQVEIMIGVNGKVISPVITHSSHADFEKATIKGINKYKFKPAMLNGMPIESRSTHLIFFIADEFPQGPNKKQFALYEEGLKLLDQENVEIEKVEKIIRKISVSNNLGIRAQVYKAILEYGITKKFGSINEQHEAVSSILAFRGVKDGAVWLNEYLLYTKRLIELQSKLGLYAEAKKLYNELYGLYPNKVGILELQVERIEKLLLSGKPYQQTVFLNKRGDDFLLLSGKEFYIENINGEIENLHFRCQAKYKKLKFDQENNYRVPESWGECLLQIEGIPKTEAKLIQMGKGNKFEEVSASPQNKD